MINTADKEIIYLDGAMGTMLQRSGLKMGEKPEVFGMQHPDVVRDIHLRYINAGSDVIYANTFGANSHKYEGSGYDISQVIAANIRNARAAADSVSKIRKVRVALDVGPIGELMEPLGTLSFEDAYECFKQIVVSGEDAGADLVVFETMTDLAEVRAAVVYGTGVVPGAMFSGNRQKTPRKTYGWMSGIMVQCFCCLHGT